MISSALFISIDLNDMLVESGSDINNLIILIILKD